jgi:hypothetical protein
MNASNANNCDEFGVLTAVRVFWGMTPCSLVDRTLSGLEFATKNSKYRPYERLVMRWEINMKTDDKENAFWG